MKPARLLARLLTGLALLAWLPTASADPVALDMARAESGNFYLHAGLGGAIETDMLLDTGAGYVSLSRDTFRRIQAESEPRFSRHIYGAMANGKVEKIPLYVIAELRLADNCVLRDIEVAVLAGADRDILGLNALTRLEPLTLQLSSNRLTSSGCAS